MSKASQLFQKKMVHCPVIRKACGFKDAKQDVCYKLNKPLSIKKADGEYRLSCPSSSQKKKEGPGNRNIEELPNVY